jgi:hypothetical protein
MPITRRKRANPPDQPENNHHVQADQTEGAVEQPLHSEPAPSPLPATVAEKPENPPVETGPSSPLAASDTVVPNQAEEIPNPPPLTPPAGGERNGNEHITGIEGGRRTARGELFRRPPQVPVQQQASFVSSAPLQAPTHEITLPLGNLLHLAYNPGYTGSEEARSLLLHRLTEESNAGGRARCWNCGSLAIAYDRWNTRSRSFGDVGIAFCEICGVWSVM